MGSVQINVISFLVFCIFFSCKVDTNKNTTKVLLSDNQNNQVELNRPARRVICLFNPSMDLMYMLQAQDKIVAVPAEVYFDPELFDYYKYLDVRIANNELPSLGNNEFLNLESIVQFNPDLVIAKYLPETISNALAKQGVKVYFSRSEKYDELIKEIRDIASLIGMEDRAEKIIAYTENKRNEFARDWEMENNVCKSAYVSWTNCPISLVHDNILTDCLDVAGVEDIRWLSTSSSDLERLRVSNPDIVIVCNNNSRLLYNQKELRNVNAIKNKQVYDLSPMFFYDPQTLKSICAILAIHHWAYPDNSLNVSDEVKDVFTVLYGKEKGERLMESYYLTH